MKGLVCKDLKLLAKMDNRIHVKVTPSQELSDALIRMSKEKGED